MHPHTTGTMSLLSTYCSACQKHKRHKRLRMRRMLGNVSHAQARACNAEARTSNAVFALLLRCTAYARSTANRCTAEWTHTQTAPGLQVKWHS